MRCPECNTPASVAAARYCETCGVALPGGSTTSRSPEAPAEAGAAPERAEDEVTTSVLTPPEGQATDLRSCVSCGAANSARRELCGRCGADLDTGISPPGPVDEPAPHPTTETVAADHGRRRWAWWLLPAGLLGVAALVLGGLTLAGLGPFAGPPSLAEATFEPEAYGEPEVLLLAEIAARTTMAAGTGDRYDPSMMVDDDPSTAWRNDGSQFEQGVGETIDLYLDEPAWVQRLVITNGYQLDPETYAADARIHRAAVVFDGGERVTIRLEDLAMQRQAIDLPEPVLTTTVRIEVLETFPGDDDLSLAVSDLHLEGHRAQGDDVEIAEERAARARAVPRSR